MQVAAEIKAATMLCSSLVYSVDALGTPFCLLAYKLVVDPRILMKDVEWGHVLSDCYASAQTLTVRVPLTLET